jgi:rubrerythrin
MNEVINTCSQAISLAKELEEQSAKFYENFSKRSAEAGDLFLSFAKENGKFVTQVQRAYYGVITDAFEGCFAFDMNPEVYVLDTELTDETGLDRALAKALAIEERIVDFYTTAAEQSKSLMADVPRAFTLVVKKRNKRLATLKSLIEKGG